MKPDTLQTIESDTDYQAALGRIDQLFGAAPGTPEGKTLDKLLALVEDWERVQGYELPNP